ncbi:flagellin [Lederbergia galactosidilytica]|uniref:flagellin N-terminal helical domain-containing protein n=1 Tax=Lederbergia galactosidilytica TaxID=217031 RepID=UPI0007DB0E98|nr:flagellin [Lederbergia galactosidilytica]
MRINHNISALNAYNHQQRNVAQTSRVMEKLVSGMRINRAADDAAGLNISEKMRAQTRGLSQADRNILDGVSLVQVADGGLDAIHSALQRMRELSVQSANDTLTDSDRIVIQQETIQLKNTVDDIATSTTFNQIHLLDGSNPYTSSIGGGGGSYQYENVLALPPVSSNGMFQFGTNLGYPTTENDNNQPLVYGSGSTSYPSIKIGANVYGLHTNISSNVSVLEPLAEENGQYKVVYQVIDEGVDVKVSQFVNIVKDKYQIRYSIENQSEKNLEIGFLFNIDTQLGSDDSAPFIVNDAPIRNETRYQGENIPNSFVVYNNNGTNPELQAHGILKNTDEFPIIEEPHQFGIGQWTMVDKWDWIPSGGFGDSAYSIWWKEREIGTDDSFEVNTYYGLAVPPTIENPNNADQEGPYDVILQVGANEGDLYKIQLTDARTESLAIDRIDISTQRGAEQAIRTLDKAIGQVSGERSKWGAYQNALEHIYNNVTNTSENLNSALSRIKDADMALEMTKYTKNNILAQSAQAMVAQSQQIPQGILQLLKEN